jgi:hypothetical protein
MLVLLDKYIFYSQFPVTSNSNWNQRNHSYSYQANNVERREDAKFIRGG